MSTKAELEKELESLYFKEKDRITANQGGCIGFAVAVLLGLFLYGTVLPHGNTNVTFKLEDMASDFSSYYRGDYRVCRVERGDFAESSCGIMEEYGAALSDFNRKIIRETKDINVNDLGGKVNQCLDSDSNGNYVYTDCNGGKK